MHSLSLYTNGERATLTCVFYQQISGVQLEELVNAVHETRLQGGAVLIHCAQGRSRSATASASYVASVLGTQWLPCAHLKDVIGQTLEVIKEGRRMANPNANFEAQLRQHAKDGLFHRLRAELEEGVDK